MISIYSLYNKLERALNVKREYICSMPDTSVKELWVNINFPFYGDYSTYNRPLGYLGERGNSESFVSFFARTIQCHHY